MKTLQIRSMPEGLHRELSRQAAEQGVSLNRLLLGYLSDIARINRHLTATQQPDSTEMLRRSKRRPESLPPSRQEIVETIRDLRGAE